MTAESAIENDRVATFTMNHPSGHEMVIRVFLSRAQSEYWASWSFPALRKGRPCYRTGTTSGAHATLESCLSEAVVAVQAMDSF